MDIEKKKEFMLNLYKQLEELCKENQDLKLFNMSADVIIKELKEDLKYKEEELEQISDFNEAHRQKKDELEEENEELKETIKKYKERYGGLSL